MEFYKKNLFLFNPNFSKSFHNEVVPFIKTPEGLCRLFKNESIIIKKFIYEIENEILDDYEEYSKNISILQLNKNLKNTHSNSDSQNKIIINAHLEKIRKHILNYFSKMINFYFDSFYSTTKEICLVNSEIGIEGAIILSYLLKKNKKISILNISCSKIKEDELNILLGSVENHPNFFTLDLTGTIITQNNLKYIKRILSDDLKKHIIYDNSGNSKISKLTADNNKRMGKFKNKKKNRPNIIYLDD